MRSKPKSSINKGKSMSVLATLPAGTYTIDASHSRVGFSARHAMVTKVRGSFNDYTGSAVVADGAASISIDINVASVDTRSADRDGHLQSPDFFDVANFPKITLSQHRSRIQAQISSQ